MPVFDPFGKIINNNNNNNNNDEGSPATESTIGEIRHDGFGNGKHSIYSAEPNQKNPSSDAPTPLPEKLQQNK